MGRLVDVVVPRRLGVGFRWLLASSWASNLGDGVALAAGPLLVVSLTREAFLVALAVTVQWLPPLLFGVALAALFVLATVEVFADNSAQTLLPMLVARQDLAVANSRLQAGFITVNQLAGPPLGAALFTIGAAWAFGAQAAVVALGGVLMTRLVVPRQESRRIRSTRVRQDVAEGFGWVLRHAAVRTLVLTIFAFNITFGAAWSVLVL